ncbi:MAG: hypothetical protein Fur0043_09920 [Anaerolineales bacterium]
MSRYKIFAVVIVFQEQFYIATEILHLFWVSIQACHCEERSACTVPQAHVCDSIPFGDETISQMPDLIVGTGDCFPHAALGAGASLAMTFAVVFFSMAE